MSVGRKMALHFVNHMFFEKLVIRAREIVAKQTHCIKIRWVDLLNLREMRQKNQTYSKPKSPSIRPKLWVGCKCYTERM